MLLDHNLFNCSKVLQSAVHSAGKYLPVYLTHQKSFSKRSTFDSTIKKVFQNTLHSTVQSKKFFKTQYICQVNIYRNYMLR